MKFTKTEMFHDFLLGFFSEISKQKKKIITFIYFSTDILYCKMKNLKDSHFVLFVINCNADDICNEENQIQNNHLY